MADVLRVVERFGGLADSPACRAYVARATGRPAFAKARDDQMAHFAAGMRHVPMLRATPTSSVYPQPREG